MRIAFALTSSSGALRRKGWRLPRGWNMNELAKGKYFGQQDRVCQGDDKEERKSQVSERKPQPLSNVHALHSINNWNRQFISDWLDFVCRFIHPQIDRDHASPSQGSLIQYQADATFSKINFSREDLAHSRPPFEGKMKEVLYWPNVPNLAVTSIATVILSYYWCSAKLLGHKMMILVITIIYSRKKGWKPPAASLTMERINDRISLNGFLIVDIVPIIDLNCPWHFQNVRTHHFPRLN
jgi:hypothetical protein